MRGSPRPRAWDFLTLQRCRLRSQGPQQTGPATPRHCRRASTGKALSTAPATRSPRDDSASAQRLHVPDLLRRQPSLRHPALCLHARHQGISGRRQGREVQRPPAGCPFAIAALPELRRNGTQPAARRRRTILPPFTHKPHVHEGLCRPEQASTGSWARTGHLF